MDAIRIIPAWDIYRSNCCGAPIAYCNTRGVICTKCERLLSGDGGWRSAGLDEWTEILKIMAK